MSTGRTVACLSLFDVWVVASGSSFKFSDYASALGRELPPHDLDGGESVEDLMALTCSPPRSVGAIQQELHKSFLGLRRALSVNESGAGCSQPRRDNCS